LPDIVLLKNPPHIRDVILATCAVEHIADAGRAFPGVNTDAVAMIARRGPADGHRVTAWRSLPLRWRDAPPPAVSIPQATFAELPRRTFNIHLSDEALALWRKLDAFGRLGDRFEMHEGVHTGNARAKLFLPARAHRHCVPIVVGRDEVQRFQVRWGGTWLDRHPHALDRR